MTAAPTRPTRAESQALTRQRLIKTAREIFLTEGYAASSLEKVADEAGFSKGAVYSNFAGKDDLCLAVLELIHQEVARVVLGAFTEPSLDEALRAFDLWAEARLGDPDWSALEAEFSARSRRDPNLRQALAARDERTRQMIRGALQSTAAVHGLQFLMPIDDVAAAIFSLGAGLGLQRAITPELPVRLLSDVIRVLAGLSGTQVPSSAEDDTF